MDNIFSYDSNTGERLHSNDIEVIAMDMGVPADEVRRLYNFVLKRFKRGARIMDFLPILASRRVKHLLYARMRKKGRGIVASEYLEV